MCTSGYVDSKELQTAHDFLVKKAQNEISAKEGKLTRENYFECKFLLLEAVQALYSQILLRNDMRKVCNQVQYFFICVTCCTHVIKERLMK